MARVVKKVKKSKAYRQKRMRIIMSSILGVAVLVTSVILLVMFLRPETVYTDPFDNDDFNQFQMSNDEFESFLDSGGALQYVFVFVYNHKTFDLEENEAHQRTYDAIRDFRVNYLEAIRQAEEGSIDRNANFVIINAGNGHGYESVTTSSILGGPGPLGFIVLEVDSSGEHTRRNLFDTEAENSDQISGSANDLSRILEHTIRFFQERTGMIITQPE